jgi:hypothetical protein
MFLLVSPISPRFYLAKHAKEVASSPTASKAVRPSFAFFRKACSSGEAETAKEA